MKPLLYIVIPCYNEEKVLPVTAPLFLNEVQTLIDKELISENSKILFVNDGSRDKTWEIIKSFSAENAHFEGLCLSRNRGHQNALLAGLMYAKDYCDISISIDCDGQDDIGAMEEMIVKYLEGFDVVYGVRSSRDTDSFFKRTTAQGFYKFMKLMGVETVYNHADYRLMSKKALIGLSEFDEVNIFLRGMIPLVGYASTSVYYVRNKRLAGESHYPLKKMIALAVDGITSLSIKPIRIVTSIGFVVTLLSLVGIIWSVVQHFISASVSGWASTVAIICFLGGIQLLCIGIIGEYIGKIYMEVKHRPKYIISEKTETENNSAEK